ncbi:MAG: M48 family metallopeptidase [Gammaproteobacteria bacterium]|nr:M48 family metallopeptidase [Gammaproteobacteria bacterium]
MTTAQNSLDGIYYDGHRPVGINATLSISDSGVTFSGREDAPYYSLPDLRVSPRIAQADRYIKLPDGGQFQCPDCALLDRFTQESAEGWIAWLEARVALAVLGIGIVMAALLLGYFYGLPKAAEYIAARIPMETERILGDQGLEWMEENNWLQPTTISDVMQIAYRHDFETLRQGLPQASHYQLEFRNAPHFGANAFALPGGIIVVTDALANVATGRDQFAAVLAHEMGHVEHRHTLRLTLQNSAVLLAVATVVGDAATLGVAAVPAVLAQTQYSREFESEADEFAFALLKQHGMSPEAFASVMLRMSEANEKAGPNEPIGFLSTHPLTQERIERARAAAH